MRKWIDADTMEIRGHTAEGAPFVMWLEYAPGAPDGADPVRMHGCYAARDGVDSFECTRADELPRVITESDWGWA